MRVITPLEITNTRLTSSTIAEPDTGETAWNAATSYTLGQVVIRTTTHKKYENILAGIDAGLPENTPTRWIEIGSTNRYAMFDTLRNTKSTQASSLTVVITPAVRVDAIGLLSIYADDVTITITSGASTVYTYTKNLDTRIVTNWYDYFFAEFTKIPNIVLFDIPPYTDAVITIEFTCSTSVSVGAVVVGNQTYLGKVIYGAVSEEVNFSRIEREVTGEAILLQRRSVPKINANVIASKTLLNKIRDTRRNLNAINAVWSGLDDKIENPRFETLLALGVYKRFEIDISNPEYDQINLEIEEL